MVWTDEKVKLLVQHWEAGQSITQIGKQLGMTRNAVVGKAHRIGLAKRASPIMRSDKPAQPRQSAATGGSGGGGGEAVHHRVSTPRAPAQPRSEDGAGPAQSSSGGHAGQPQLTAALLAALTPSTGPRCKWPIGDPKTTDFDFCAHVALPGKPYCASHCAQAYTNWNPESAVEAVKAINAA